MRRRTALLCVAVLAVLAAPHAGAATARQAAKKPSVKAPVVALIDTGVFAQHQEFDYRGASSTADQFVAWFDFTKEKKGAFYVPGPGQLWDDRVRDPYDGYGHGTLTAAMVGGKGLNPAMTRPAAPGTKLAIARVGDKDGTINGDIGAAVRWAADTVHADVINISIGTRVPFPADVYRADYDAIAAARRAGVLVVVANGNGYVDAGIPGDPGWANFASSSPDVLAVGASDSNQYTVNTDPEVTAVFSITGPSTTDRSGYARSSGTSFGSPYVAGFAAALVRAGREGGHPLTADRLELLLKSSATDTGAPAAFEGYGVLSANELSKAVTHARAGTLPAVNSSNELYVESVSGTLRTIWTAA